MPLLTKLQNERGPRLKTENDTEEESRMQETDT